MVCESRQCGTMRSKSLVALVLRPRRRPAPAAAPTCARGSIGFADCARMKLRRATSIEPGVVTLTPIEIGEDFTTAVSVQADGNSATFESTRWSVVCYLRDGG